MEKKKYIKNIKTDVDTTPFPLFFSEVKYDCYNDYNKCDASDDWTCNNSWDLTWKMTEDFKYIDVWPGVIFLSIFDLISVLMSRLRPSLIIH